MYKKELERLDVLGEREREREGGGGGEREKERGEREREREEREEKGPMTTKNTSENFEHLPRRLLSLSSTVDLLANSVTVSCNVQRNLDFSCPRFSAFLRMLRISRKKKKRER